MQPYQPYNLDPLGGKCIDASDNNIFTWTFSDPIPRYKQSAYYIEYRENIIGSNLSNTGWILSDIPRHNFIEGLFNNNSTYAWRVKVKDDSPRVNLFPDDAYVVDLQDISNDVNGWVVPMGDAIDTGGLAEVDGKTVQFGIYTGVWSNITKNENGIIKQQFNANDGNVYYFDPNGIFVRWIDSPTFNQEILTLRDGTNVKTYSDEVRQLVARLVYDPVKVKQYYTAHPLECPQEQESITGVVSEKVLNSYNGTSKNFNMRSTNTAYIYIPINTSEFEVGTKFCFSMYAYIPTLGYTDAMDGAYIAVEQINETINITKSNIVKITGDGVFKRLEVVVSLLEGVNRFKLSVCSQGKGNVYFSCPQFEVGSYSTTFTLPSAIQAESEFSDWVVFRASAKPIAEIIYPIKSGDIEYSQIPTIKHSYEDFGGVPQKSYQYFIYDDYNNEVFKSKLLMDKNNSYIIPKGILKNNNKYYVKVEVESNNGAKATSLIKMFITNFKESTSTLKFIVSSDEKNAKFNISYQNIMPINGIYENNNEELPKYLPAKFNNGLNISEYGEKVKFNFKIPKTFTLTNWFIPNNINDIKTILYLYQDNLNYLKFKYNNALKKFILETFKDNNGRCIGSPEIYITNTQPIFYSIKQNDNGIIVYTGINGILYKWGDY